MVHCHWALSDIRSEQEEKSACRRGTVQIDSFAIFCDAGCRERLCNIAITAPRSLCFMHPLLRTVSGLFTSFFVNIY